MKKIHLNKQMKLIEMILDEKNLINGVEAISIVESPAIGENFIAMQEEAKGYTMEFKEMDKEKRLLVGAALIPNKPIYRNFDGEDVHVFFSAETVRRASQLYLILGNQSNATLEHQLSVNGVHLVESWIIENAEKDKAASMGFSLPVGTWMVTLFVENDTIWNEYVKTGKVKGFSIEGFFVDSSMVRQTKQKEQEKTPEEQNRDKVKKILEPYAKSDSQ